MSTPVYLIDASIYIFQAYFSPYNEMSDEDGEDMSAFVGFLQFLMTLQRRARPYAGAVAMDNALFTGFRHALSPSYKSNRELPDENLARQLTYCAQAAAALGWPVFASERYEADDIIGTLSRTARLSGVDEHGVCLVSRDKDLAQLVEGPQDTLFDFSANKRRNRIAIEKDWGVSTQAIPDFLGLVGDAVDCIAGVPGVGPVKAQALLTEFGSLEGIYANLAHVPALALRGARGLADKLAAHESEARLCKVLATIVQEPENCEEDFARVTGQEMRLGAVGIDALSAVLVEARLPVGLQDRLRTNCANLVAMGEGE